ncbi:MetQ/NlpA family ABC transporter substrate-binding protein [Lentibacillus amyloliquefaciens]|uniref:Lipoprotein n=1 Tax=Lentibacillus amyloliquefaciens TaxID=1472767 RepID=A0A0U4F9K5_9BACI|nr:MetQ/NlpA family ABC transporter substrate-binding protein [Lentibacillus amyloliquefaciens]ALX47165.1 methionine ABC transporter substrate-binding protein [Lentibacillus amyloliquefaciens]
MKKALAFVSVLIVVLLAACGESASGDSSELKVGASSTPHAQILEEAKPLLEEEGIELTIEEYQDYVLPNEDLSNGEIDANYFQHIPYLEGQIADIGFDFTHLGGIHIEPMGIYSKDFNSIDEVPEGTEVLMSRSVADHGRVLGLLEKEGLIKLAEDVNTVDATTDDIVENPKNLTFSYDYDPATLPNLYETEENTLVAINTNFAIGADLTPTEDALILEGEESPYVNVVAVKKENEDNEAINTLVDVLHSDEIQNFIKEEFNGAIVPVDGKAE